MYKIIGYYICELTATPEYLADISRMRLSVSGCFGGVHPDLDYCFFQNNLRKQRQEYRKALNLSDEKITMLENEIGELFEKRLAIDGRFLGPEDAKRFYNNYFSGLNCRIVSVSTTEEHYEILKAEFQDNSNSVADFMNDDTDENELIGWDILGWDISGFHSFLCNSLHKELQTARFNEYGLLDNDFCEVAEFARRIMGKGEPVEWIPCRLGSCL